jgi:hypothetical protein
VSKYPCELTGAAAPPAQPLTLIAISIAAITNRCHFFMGTVVLFMKDPPYYLITTKQIAPQSEH